MIQKIKPVIIAATLSAACTMRLPGMQDPSVEIARIIADAQVKTVQAVTAAMAKAQASACEVVK